MSEYIRLQANGADAYPDASTENTYRPNGTSVESALVNLESNVTTLGGVAGEAKTLAEQNSVKIATAEQEISDINSSLGHLNDEWIEIGNTNNSTKLDISVDLSIYKKIALLSIGTGSFLGRIFGIVCVPISIFRNHDLFVPTAGEYIYGVHVWYVDENTIRISSEKTDTYAYVYGIK